MIKTKIESYETTSKLLEEKNNQFFSFIQTSINNSISYEIEISSFQLSKFNITTDDFVHVLIEKGYRVIRKEKTVYAGEWVDSIEHSYIVSWRLGESAEYIKKSERKGLTVQAIGVIIIIASIVGKVMWRWFM